MVVSSQLAIRPKNLSEFEGQPEIRRQLEVILGSARTRGDLPGHLLFSGPPGLGKTTLANVVGAELGVPLITSVGGSLEKPADVITLLQSFRSPTVVFIDEIHGMSKLASETLYSAMEDGFVSVAVGDQHVPLHLAPFVLVGATTQQGSLLQPLRDRFSFIGRLNLYSVDDLTSIVSRNAEKMGIGISREAAHLIAERSQGTPRIAQSLLGRVRDVAVVQEHPEITPEVVSETMEMFGVDNLGLDDISRRVLRVLHEQFSGGPVGGSSLASAVGEPLGTLESVYEPHLMEYGLLQRTPKGRVLTDAGRAHLGV